MKYFVLGIAAILIVCILFEAFRKTTRRKTGAAPAESWIATGCMSRESCMYLNLGRATSEGKQEGYCWCEYYKEFKKRQDNCPGFKSRGCLEGMCVYADFKTPKENGYSSKYCYCSYFNEILEGRTSCSYYIDYFETTEGNEVRKVFQNMK